MKPSKPNLDAQIAAIHQCSDDDAPDLDARWDALAAGVATEQQRAELVREAATSERAALALHLFTPLPESFYRSLVAATEAFAGPADESAELLRRALDALRAGRGSDPTVHQLVHRWTPILHARVARTLLGGGDARRETMEELVQSIWAQLFANEAAFLRKWDPRRGLSLDNWVGRFAMLRTRDFLRRNASALPAAHEVDLEGWAGPDDTSGPAIVSDLWRDARHRVLRGQSALKAQMFEMLIEERLEVAEVAERTGLSASAILQWRSRLRQELRAVLGVGKVGAKREDT